MMWSLLRVALLALPAAVAPAETIFVQAEEFECDSRTWIAREQNSPYAPDSGVKHLWGATGGQGAARRTVQVPAAGRYRVWVRHTVMDRRGPTSRGAFLVRVLQGQTVLAEGRFDEQPPAQDPARVHRYDWNHFTADLPAGPVTLELSKLPPLICSGYTRYVDCLALTTDDRYVPHESDFQPKVWLRVKLGPAQTTPIYIHCFADHFRAPWYQHASLSKSGFEPRVAPARGKAVYLSAGEATPWCDITSLIHEDRGARLELRGAEKYSYEEWLPSLDATFEFATAPDEAAVVKWFARQGPGAGLVVVTPGVLNSRTADQLKSDADYCAQNQALAGSLPPVTFGRRPERFPFFLSIGLRPGLFAPDLRLAEYGVAARLGFNGGYDPVDPLLTSAGFRYTRTGPSVWFMDHGCYLQPETERIRQQFAAKSQAWQGAPPSLVMLMDEPSAKPLEHAVGCARCAEVFRSWLRDERRVVLAELGRDTWAAVAPVGTDQRDAAPALYYWSQRFRVKAFGDFLRLQTAEAGRSYPGAPPATVNFSDGAVYEANLYLMGADYFELFRSRALTMAWSEDWSNIASTYQCAGYNVDLLRAAVKYHDQPVGMYLITSYGRTPLDVKLKAYSSLGRGVSVLHSFAYGPHYTNHEPNWYLNRPMYAAMSELTREVGGAEDLLVPARRVPAQVAFLYSTTSDIWTTGVTDLYGFDRMHSYLALLHAQVPVDFLSEDDVAEGRLQPYRALYLFGPNLLGRAAGPIADWVRAGGVLYLAGGAAVADEYNRPARPLDDRLSLKRGEPRTQQTFQAAGRYLTQLKSQGRVAIDGGGSADLYGAWQPIMVQPSDTVTARGADGQVMAARVVSGRGKVFVCGFAPGLSYIHQALERRDAQGSPAPAADNPLQFDTQGSFANLRPQDASYNPWEYPQAERELLLAPVREAAVVKPVTLSHPLVETFYLSGPPGAVVTLANYALKPIANLEVAIRCGKQPVRVASVRRGELPWKLDGGAIVVRLPLTDTDVVKLYW